MARVDILILFLVLESILVFYQYDISHAFFVRYPLLGKEVLFFFNIFTPTHLASILHIINDPIYMQWVNIFKSKSPFKNMLTNQSCNEPFRFFFSQKLAYLLKQGIHFMLNSEIVLCNEVTLSTKYTFSYLFLCAY